MSFTKKVFDSVKKRGAKGFLQYGLQKFLGISQWRDEISTLQSILDQSIDITSIGPTKDVALRQA